MRLLTASRSASSSKPQGEDSQVEPEDVEAPPSSPKPITKTNMVAHEVRVNVTGAHPAKKAGERELFSEETLSVLVFENGGVIQLSAAVAPGQLLFLANMESKREVVAQVIRKRAYKPTICYVELEFAEPAPGFWGMEFSAASALLPKDAKEAEAAALVNSAEATDDEPGEPPAAPAVAEVQALRREVEALREQLKLMQTPAASQQAPSTAMVPYAPVTEPDSNSGSDKLRDAPVRGKSRPIEYDPAPPQWTAAEQSLLPRPSLDFTRSLPKPKRLQWARGNFTPGFREGVLRLSLLTAALVVTAAGAAWYKHWIPWKSVAKTPSFSGPAIPANARTSSPQPVSREEAKEQSEFSNAKVASDAPATSPGLPSQPAEYPAPAFSSGSSVVLVQPRVAKTSPPAIMAEKHPTVRPTAHAASNAVVASTADSVVVPPKLIQSVRALASLDALHDFETGNVVIDAVVGPEGEVHFISVISGPPSLRPSAVEAVKQYRYQPATRNGQAVPAHVNITIRFRFES
jgi:periplasmic protein TonB